MSRALSTNLNLAQVSREKSPAIIVVVYDVKSGNISITNVVEGDVPELDPDRREFTNDIVALTYKEVVSDYSTVGLAAPIVTFTIEDEGNVFDPFNTVAAPTGDGRWLRRGNVVQVLAGDERVPDSEYTPLFTGLLSGQAGVARSRSSQFGPVGQITCKAIGREAGFLQFDTTSNNFVLDTGYTTIVNDLATIDMALDSGEINFPTFSGRLTGHTNTQFVEESPLISIGKVTFVDGFLPIFDGAGILTAKPITANRAPTRAYTAAEDATLFNIVETTFTEVNPVNRVTVIGLDANMTKISQPLQVLAKADLTMGFFADEEELDVYFNEDRTQLGENLDLNVVRSMNASIFGLVLGGSEGITAIGAPGPGEGEIGATIEVETGFAPEVVGLLTISYIATSFIPDTIAGIGVGVTQPVGRAIQAALLVVILTIMQRQGRGSYEIIGNPFEYVFQEIRGIAEIAGLLSHEVNELEIENHMIQDQATADARASDVLFLEQSKGNPRTVNMHFDLVLEAGDIYERSDNRTYYIAAQSVTYVRGAQAIMATQTVYETTPGIFSDGSQA